MINPQRCLRPDMPRSRLEWIIFSDCATSAGEKAACVCVQCEYFFFLLLLIILLLLLGPNYVFPPLKSRKSGVWVAAVKKKKKKSFQAFLL